MIHNIAAKALKELLDTNEAVLVAVREPHEYAEQHIEGAILAPLATVTLDKLPKHKNKKLVFQCQAGKRSGMACDRIGGGDKTIDVYLPGCLGITGADLRQKSHAGLVKISTQTGILSS